MSAVRLSAAQRGAPQRLASACPRALPLPLPLPAAPPTCSAPPSLSAHPRPVLPPDPSMLPFSPSSTAARMCARRCPRTARRTQAAARTSGSSSPPTRGAWRAQKVGAGGAPGGEPPQGAGTGTLWYGKCCTGVGESAASCTRHLTRWPLTQPPCCRPAGRTPFSAFGVFDGHGGRQVATFASNSLLKAVMAEVDRAPEPLQVSGRGRGGGPCVALLSDSTFLVCSRTGQGCPGGGGPAQTQISVLFPPVCRRCQRWRGSARGRRRSGGCRPR